MFEVGTAVDIKRWVFIGSLQCLKWYRYDLRGRLQIVSGVMKLRYHALAEVGLRAWTEFSAVLAVWFVCFVNQEKCKHANECASTHPCYYGPQLCLTPTSSLPNMRQFIPAALSDVWSLNWFLQ